MNILWISFLGSWTIPLLKTINQTNRVGIIIPNIEKKQNQFEEKEGICFYSLALSSKECYTNMNLGTYYKYKKIIDAFQPDIIHVYGTEKNLAQIGNFMKDIPIVISIQGLLIGCKPYAFNYLEKKSVRKFKTLKNLLGRGGFSLMYKVLQRGESYEYDILTHGNYFIGRTSWDEAYIMFCNPKARYFKGEELLRDVFYEHAASWNIHTCNRYSIFMPSGFNPIKGLHLAIETVRLLKQYYPEVRLIVPGITSDFMGKSRLTNRVIGEEYLIYNKKKIKEYGLEKNIWFLPHLSPSEMVEQMQKCHLFLSPSSIDNSPNAVGESMMIGAPVVSTPVGGLLSFLKDEDSVLFAPAGNPYMMAFQIKRIFENDNLAVKISRKAHEIALKRHNIDYTSRQYVDIYQQIIEDYQNKFK